MIYKTYFEDRSKFDSLKETGMGYQIISAKQLIRVGIQEVEGLQTLRLKTPQGKSGSPGYQHLKTIGE
jgi:hypothetical protein